MQELLIRAASMQIHQRRHLGDLRVWADLPVAQLGRLTCPVEPWMFAVADGGVPGVPLRVTAASA
jgi:hypothetical protein